MWTVTAHFILPVQNLQVSICLRSIKAKAFHNFPFPWDFRPELDYSILEITTKISLI